MPPKKRKSKRPRLSQRDFARLKRAQELRLGPQKARIMEWKALHGKKLVEFSKQLPEKMKKHVYEMVDGRIDPDISEEVRLCSFAKKNKREREVSKIFGLLIVDHPLKEIRYEASFGLYRIAGREDIPALKQALKDPWWRVRKNAAWAFLRFGTLNDLPLLEANAKNDYGAVRKMAAEVISQIQKIPDPKKRWI